MASWQATVSRFAIAFTLLLVRSRSVSDVAWAQSVPAIPDRAWSAPASQAGGSATGAGTTQEVSGHQTLIDASHRYTLAELIDLAESHNPDTRVAWQQAKARAADLGVARSALLPLMAVEAAGGTTRERILFNSSYVRQTQELFQPVLQASYTIFDFGAREAMIEEARQRLVAANFQFNSVHLSILYETSRRYYAVLNAAGQREAAEVNLKNALAVKASVDARLSNGLATLPDALEAAASAQQADFELQATVGQVEIARGSLLHILGAAPFVPLEVQALNELTVPDAVDDTVAAAIDRGLTQRPELAERVAERRVAVAEIKGARSAYLPTLTVDGYGGELRTHGQQDQLPGAYTGPQETWDADLRLRWTLFDGGRREAELARSHADERAAAANLESEQNAVEEEVWMSWSELQTAFRQRTAAAALLVSAHSSYDASLKSYQYGLRNTVDVVTAQRGTGTGDEPGCSSANQCADPACNDGLQDGRFDQNTESCETPMRAAGTVLLSCVLMTAGCRRAPAFNVLGSFFPGWIACIVFGVLMAVLVRAVMARLEWERYLKALPLVYLSVVLIFACLLWLVVFE